MNMNIDMFYSLLLCDCLLHYLQPVPDISIWENWQWQQKNFQEFWALNKISIRKIFLRRKQKISFSIFVSFLRWKSRTNFPKGEPLKKKMKFSKKCFLCEGIWSVSHVLEPKKRDKTHSVADIKFYFCTISWEIFWDFPTFSKILPTSS